MYASRSTKQRVYMSDFLHSLPQIHRLDIDCAQRIPDFIAATGVLYCSDGHTCCGVQNLGRGDVLLSVNQIASLEVIEWCYSQS